MLDFIFKALKNSAQKKDRRTGGKIVIAQTAPERRKKRRKPHPCDSHAATYMGRYIGR